MRQFFLILVCGSILFLLSCDRTDLGKEMSMGVAEARQGHYEQALVHATSCVAFAPDNVDALLLKSFCQFMVETKSERRRQPLMTLLKCTHLAPERFEPWYFYGWALVENGQLRDAIEPLRQAIKLLSPTDARCLEIKLLLERCYTANNLINEALGILQPLQGRLPYRNAPGLYNELGLLAIKRPTPTSAERLFQRGLQLDPHNEVLLLNLAITYDLYLNNISEARRYYQYCMAAKFARHDIEGSRNIQNRLRQLAIRR